MKALELFAGIGGVALAAEWADIETVAFCERDPFCQKVLKKHWSHVPIFEDIRTLNKQALTDGGVDVGSIELISGGFPCQPYSIAGKRKGTEDDRDLWPEMFRVIKEIKPTWVVGENVANFVNMELERTLIDLESEGYETRTFIIPACAVNAKHRRDRTFIVAYSDSSWKLQSQGSIEEFRKRLGDNCKNVSHTHSKGLERENQPELESRNSTGCSRSGERWATEPDVGRVANGIPNRVDRIRGLGNAVVPQQIYPILKAIKEIHDGRFVEV